MRAVKPLKQMNPPHPLSVGAGSVSGAAVVIASVVASAVVSGAAVVSSSVVAGGLR